MCFWSVKPEREAADNDPEPNGIAWELSEATQNAFEKFIFNSVFPSHFLTWHLHPTGIPPLESCWCPDCVYRGISVSLPVGSQGKCLRFPTLLERKVAFPGTVRAQLSQLRVLTGPSPYRTHVLNYVSFQYKTNFHYITKNIIIFYPVDHLFIYWTLIFEK